MAGSQTSTLPPNLKRLNLSLEDIHLLTALPLTVLELYQQGRYKPTGLDRVALQHAASLFYDRMKPPAASVFIDKIRFKLLSPILPQEEIDGLLALANYEDYRRRLLELCDLYSDELESAIARNARENGYDPDHE